MRLVRMVRKLPGGLDMIEVIPSEVETKKAEGYAVLKVREGEDPLEVYKRGHQAAEKPTPPPSPPPSEPPEENPSVAEVLAQKSDAELKIIAKQYGVEDLEAGKEDLIVKILTKAGYKVERVDPKGKEPQQPRQEQAPAPPEEEASGPAASPAPAPEASEPPKE